MRRNRDARILPIHEGANGIQAIDMMGRKLAIGEGKAVREPVAEIFPTASALKNAAATPSRTPWPAPPPI